MKVYEFGAKDCPYCRDQKREKVMERLADEFPAVKFERVDVEVREDVADRYGVEEIPTYLLVDDRGRELGRKEGAFAPKALAAFIKKKGGKSAGEEGR